METRGGSGGSASFVRSSQSDHGPEPTCQPKGGRGGGNGRVGGGGGRGVGSMGGRAVWRGVGGGVGDGCAGPRRRLIGLLVIFSGVDDVCFVRNRILKGFPAMCLMLGPSDQSPLTGLAVGTATGLGKRWENVRNIETSTTITIKRGSLWRLLGS